MLTLQVGQLYAQTRILTLDSCKSMALRNQAKVRNAVLDVEAAKATKSAALTHYFPTLSMAAGAFHSRDYLIDVNNNDVHESDNAHLDVNVAIDGYNVEASDLQNLLDILGYDIDLEREIQNLMDHVAVDAHLQMFNRGLFVNAMLTQPIYAGGRIVNGNKLAKLGVDVAELQLLMSRDEVELNVEENYWTVLSLKEKLATVQMLEQLLDTLDHDATAATEAGVIGKNDLLKVRLKKNELSAAKLQLTNGIRLATMSLCQLMGVDYSDVENVELGNHLEDLLPQLTPRLWSSDEYARIVSERKESQLLDKAVQAEELKRSMVIGEALPEVAVGATYGVNNLLGKMADNAVVFATVNVPLTGWWEISHNARKQDILRQQAELNRDDLRQKMELQVRQAVDAENEALQLLTIRRQAVSDAEENLTESRNYYDAGMIGVSDYLEAQTLLRQAQNEYVDQMVTARMASVRRRQLTNNQ